MLEGVRLVTLHPALVHFTLGGLPIIVLAYVMAAWRRSERWTFAGDVALFVTAAVTVLTAAFGLVSNWTVPWPGGLGVWRWLHLAFGASTAVLLLGLGCARALARRRGVPSGKNAALIALLTSGVAAFAGWVGGDVLVFHSGMAVKAAGNGALAPPLHSPKNPPRNLLDAMDRTREAWASATSRSSSMIVQHPSEAQLDAIVADAQELDQLASWIGREGPRTLPHAADPVEGNAHAPSSPSAPDLPPHSTRGEHLTQMATELGAHARALEAAARQRNLEDVAREVGNVAGTCADCHAELRW